MSVEKDSDITPKDEDHSSLTFASPNYGYEDTDEKTVGVKAIEIYSKQYNTFFYKVLLCVAIFLPAYSYGLDGTIRYTYQSLATSSYSQHSLIATVNCIRGVVAAAGQIFFARMSDVFGRVTMLIVAILFYVVGTIIESQAYDVQRFTAGAIFYQVGYTGVMLILEVILADFSNLNERVLMSFIPLLPFIINTWISGDVTEAVNGHWSWGIGMWAFIFPLSCIPLLCCLIHMVYLARKNGESKQIAESKLTVKSMGWWKFIVEVFFWQLDIVALLLMVCIFGCILIPFTLAGSLLSEWRRARIIVPEVVGWCVIPLYILWESKFAKYPISPGHLLKDRGVWASMIIATFINFVWYMQGDYMYTVLIVAVNESIKSATRITSLYSFVSVITGTIVGFVIIKVKRTKPFIIFGIAMWMVSLGILIYYRGDEGSHSGIIGGLCLMGFGAGFFTYVTQLSIQSCTNHEHMAVVISLYLASYNIGSSVGSSVSGAVWTNILPRELNRRLGEELGLSLYGSPFTFIVTYTWGTAERILMVALYRHVQKILCVIGLCLCVPMIASSLFLRNYRMAEIQSYENEKKDDVPLLEDFKNLFHKKSSISKDDDIYEEEHVLNDDDE